MENLQPQRRVELKVSSERITIILVSILVISLFGGTVFLASLVKTPPSQPPPLPSALTILKPNENTKTETSKVQGVTTTGTQNTSGPASPTKKPSPKPSPSKSPSPTPTPTPTASPSPSPTPTTQPTDSTPQPDTTSTPNPSPSPTPNESPSPTPTFSPEPTPTPTTL